VRVVLRLAEGCVRQPSAAIVDSHTLPSIPGNGPWAGDPLGHLLAWHVTAAHTQERAQVQAVTGDVVAVAFVDQGCTGD
jgi:hypothetical protein